MLLPSLGYPPAGANDVANAFASSVAARTLTLKQALVIAAFCEFAGATLLGGQVTRTVAGSIANLLYFDREPELYMWVAVQTRGGGGV